MAFFGLLRRKKRRERRFGRFEEADYPKLEEGLKKKFGRLEGERVRDKQRINKLEEKVEIRDKKILEMSEEKLAYSPIVKRNSLSIFELIRFSRKKKPIKLTTKNGHPLGRLWDIRINTMGNKYFFSVISQFKNKKGNKIEKAVMFHPELGEMIHNPTGFAYSVRNGFLQLTIMPDGQHVPDLYADDGKGYDEVLAEAIGKAEHLAGIASKQTERAEGERYERYLEGLGHESTKKIANSAITGLVESTKMITEASKQLGRDKIENAELRTRIELLDKKAQTANESLEKMIDKVGKALTEEEREKFREEIKENFELFAKQSKDMLEMVTKRQEEKKPLKEVPITPRPEGIMPRTLHKLKGGRKR